MLNTLASIAGGAIVAALVLADLAYPGLAQSYAIDVARSNITVLYATFSVAFALISLTIWYIEVAVAVTPSLSPIPQSGAGLGEQLSTRLLRLLNDGTDASIVDSPRNGQGAEARWLPAHGGGLGVLVGTRVLRGEIWRAALRRLVVLAAAGAVVIIAAGGVANYFRADAEIPLELAPESVDVLLIIAISGLCYGWYWLQRQISGCAETAIRAMRADAEPTVAFASDQHLVVSAVAARASITTIKDAGDIGYGDTSLKDSIAWVGDRLGRVESDMKQLISSVGNLAPLVESADRDFALEIAELRSLVENYVAKALKAPPAASETVTFKPVPAAELRRSEPEARPTSPDSASMANKVRAMLQDIGPNPGQKR